MPNLSSYQKKRLQLFVLLALLSAALCVAPWVRVEMKNAEVEREMAASQHYWNDRGQAELARSQAAYLASAHNGLRDDNPQNPMPANPRN